MNKINVINMQTEEVIVGRTTLNDSFFIDFYNIYTSNAPLSRGLIKVQLPKDEDMAFKQLYEGIQLNNYEWEEIISSASNMKDEGTNYKGCSLFYNKTLYPDMKEKLYEILSADKLKSLEGETVSINKLITSRIGLANSGTIGSVPIDMKRICLVDTTTYNHVGKYCFFNEDGELVEDTIEVGYEAYDGSGLMSPRIATSIQESLKLNNPVEYAVIRLYGGLGGKGTLLNFDFATWYKSKGIYTIKDIYGKIWNVEDIDILCNSSMLKFANLHEDINKIDYDFKEYADISNRMYILRTNTNSDIEIIKSNYQLIQQLNLSFEEIVEIAQDDISSFKQLFGDNENLDLIRIALGTKQINSNLSLLIDKLDAPLNIKAIRREIANCQASQIEKLSAFKGINLVGLYPTILPCPISFLCSIANIEDTECLEEGEIVLSGNYRSNEKVTIYKSPLDSFFQVTNHTLSRRAWASNYTSKEILFINQRDNFNAIHSSCDYDGDEVNVIFEKENPLIYKAVMESTPFYNPLDDKSKSGKLSYTPENYAKSVLGGRGNLIGSVAMQTAKLVADIQSYSNLVNEKGEVALYSEVRAWWYKNIKHNVYEEEMVANYNEPYRKLLNKQFNDWLAENKLTMLKEYSIEEQKAFIEKLFNLKKKEICRLQQLSQLLIDLPKTLQLIPEELEAEINGFMKGKKKPQFLISLGARPEECTPISKNSAMDEFRNWILSTLYYPLKESVPKETRATKQFYELFGILDKTLVSEQLYEIYKFNAKDRKDKTAREKEATDSLTMIKLMLGHFTADEIISTMYYKKCSLRFFLSFFNDLIREILNELPSKTLPIIESANGNIIYRKRRYTYKLVECDNSIDIRDQMRPYLKRKIVSIIRVENKDGLTIEDLKSSKIIIKDGLANGFKQLEPNKGKGITPDGEYVGVGARLDNSSIRGTIYIINSEKI